MLNPPRIPHVSLVAGTSRAALRSKSTGGAYTTVTDADLDFFRSVVGPSHVKTSPGDLEAFNTDWLKKYRGRSPAAVLPGTTQEVSRVLRHCNERRIAVVPQGGNTGLVGGGVPVGRVGEVVLSTSRMNAVSSFDPLAGVLVCEVGHGCGCTAGSSCGAIPVCRMRHDDRGIAGSPACW